MPNITPVIVFTNQKGGVGKTTSADAIADGLRRRGLKVLAVDMDPQGSLGRIESDCVAKGTCCSSSFLKGVQVVCTEDGQATVPGDLDLANVADERDLEGNEINEYSLTRAIESAVSQHGFDAVVVDTQPGMTFSTISSTIAATHLVIPTTADRLGTEAVEQTLELLSAVSDSYEVSWMSAPAVLITLYRGIAKLARAFASQMVEEFPKMGLKVFQRRIGITVAIQDAQANGRSIYDMNVLKGAAFEYDVLVGNIMNWCELKPAAGETEGDE